MSESKIQLDRLFQVIVQRRMKMNVLEKHYPNVKETTELSDFGADHLIMRDGTKMAVDIVILATGYVYDYPFFPPDFNLKVSRGRVAPLYRHLVHCQYTTLAFVGLANMAVFIFIADYQIRCLWVQKALTQVAHLLVVVGR